MIHRQEDIDGAASASLAVGVSPCAAVSLRSPMSFPLCALIVCVALSIFLPHSSVGHGLTLTLSLSRSVHVCVCLSLAICVCDVCLCLANSCIVFVFAFLCTQSKMGAVSVRGGDDEEDHGPAPGNSPP